MDTLGDFTTALSGIPASKRRSLALQAMSLDASNLKETLPEKRYALIVSLLNHMCVRTRDDLADMFIWRMGAIHKRARDELEQIQHAQQAQKETLEGVVDILDEDRATERADPRYAKFVPIWLPKSAPAPIATLYRPEWIDTARSVASGASFSTHACIARPKQMMGGTINGKKHWLWHAVDQHGAVLDVLVQSRRDRHAAKRLMRKLLRKHGRAPACANRG